jgi:hypothetical protein
MRKLSTAFLCACLALSGASYAQGGWLSGLTGGKKDAQQAEATQAGAVADKAGQAAAQPTPTPDPARVKKLKAALNWEKPPKDLFQQYAGKWQGDFWVYSTDGKLEQHNKVRIEYTAQADGTLKMEMWSGDLISKTWVTEVQSTYSIDGDSIVSTVRQPSGKSFKQVGHFNDGSVFFVSQISDGVEHYRERIDGKRLLVDGFGVYGEPKKKDHHVFIGRFLRQ